ncbi:MAG TPA: lysophospholipid acyltransferase family protein [Thermoanaerobaculia bacterium]|nr:lysophospholipid acyltransferase family protein [Thermoanaerobaculia bacterium]
MSATGKAPGHAVAPSFAPARRPWARRLLGPLYFSDASWYRVHYWAGRRLPEWAIRLGMPLFAAAFFLFLGGVRRALAANGRVVAERSGRGTPSWLARQIHAYRTVLHHAWCMTETYEGLAGVAPPADPEVEGLEHWEDLDHGQGLVLATAHVGHWEVGSHLAGRRGVRRVHVVREPELDPRAQEFVAGLLRAADDDRYRVHFASERDPTLGARLLVALRAGEVVALQGDRPRHGGRVLEVELLGRPYAIPLGPLALARTAGVPILPVFALRTGRRRSTLIIRPPIRVAGSSDRQAELRSGAQRLAVELEAVLLRAPDQWFCFREVWPRERAQDAGSPAG